MTGDEETVKTFIFKGIGELYIPVSNSTQPSKADIYGMRQLTDRIISVRRWQLQHGVENHPSIGEFVRPGKVSE